MNIYNFNLYIKYYVVDLIATIIHELSHFVIALFFHIITLGLLEFPKFIIKSKPVITENKLGYNSVGWKAHIFTSTYHSGLWYNTVVMIITLGPAISTILLLYFGSWYIKLFVILTIDILWLSVPDRNYIINYIKLCYRINTRNCKNYCKGYKLAF